MQTRGNGERYRKVTGVTLTVLSKGPYKWGVFEHKELEFLPKDLYASQPIQIHSSDLFPVLPDLSERHN